MTDSDNNIKTREHYEALGFADRIKAALRTIAPESQLMAVAQLAPLDQFHTRGILATAEFTCRHRVPITPGFRKLLSDHHARRPVLGLSVWNEEALSCQSS